MFEIDTINILILLVTTVNLIFGLTVYHRNKGNKSNLLFFGVALSVVFWSLSMVFYRAVNDETIAGTFARLLYFSATLIPLIFLYFAISFPNEKYNFKFWQKYYVPIPFIIIGGLSLLPSFLIKSVDILHDEEHIIVFNFIYHLIYVFYIVGYFSWGYLILLKRALESYGVLRIQILYIFVGTLISTLIGVTTNLMMPFFSNFNLNWFGQISTLIMISSISYAILKHHLFNVKVIATESLTFILWFTIFTRILFSESTVEKLINGGLFIFALIFGTLLIRATIAEVRTRERIEGLVRDLAKANDHLRQVEHQKSEFVSIASHQLRTPLTAIKGYASMILEGSFGSLKVEARDALEKLFKSSQRLVALVEDFLTVSRIERGKMEFNFESVDLQKLVQKIVNGFKYDANDKGIALTYQTEGKGQFIVRGDTPKLEQVLGNILDNAIKYTNKGFVRVQIIAVLETYKIRIAVSDTGIGMEFNTIIKLFKRFDEELSSKKSSNIGMSPGGLGMYVSNKIIKAHGGNIWAESEGLGKGSTFFVELKQVQ